jgi:phospholipid/cholesterol/gamma-HCH transport system ATP-binding protein
MQPIISVRGLVNRFGDQVVHDGLDLDIETGKVMGIVGGSGSGKSVLLRSILGLHTPNQGKIYIEGKDVGTLNADEYRQIQRHWGVLFQSSALFSSLTVAENIEFPMQEFTELTAEERQEMIAVKLHLVGLPQDAGTKFPAELSGGMKKRAALARALALDPPIIFLDEPTSGLDPISASEFDELIDYLRATLCLTVVMITHDLDSLFGICDTIAVLVDKRVIVDTPEGILSNPHPWIQKYFHGSRARLALKAD